MVRPAHALFLLCVTASCGASIPPPGPNTGAPPPSTEPPPTTQAPEPVTPEPVAEKGVHPGPEQFEPEILAFEEADRVNPPTPGGVLFVGSSSIRLWATLEKDFPRHRVTNRGFGGSRIRNVVHYVDRIVVPHAPKTVVFFAGSNDIHSGASAEQVARDFRAFVTRVRAKVPRARVVFVSITTSPSRFAEVGTVRAANALVREYVATDSDLAFVDVFSQMVDASGAPLAELYADDRLHLNSKGYALWAKLIESYLGAADSAK